MAAYIIRRLLLMIPTVLGVVLLTFVLFNFVARDPARVFAGRRASAETVEAIRVQMGLNKPAFFNIAAFNRPVEVAPVAPSTQPTFRRPGTLARVGALFDSRFFDLVRFKFPKSMRYKGRSVMSLLVEKAPISLAIEIPAFIIMLGAQLAIALFVAARRGSGVDLGVSFLCVASLALPPLAVYIFLQWLLAARLSLFPVAGWESGRYCVQYAALPVLCLVLLSLGGGIRFYRTAILEEIHSDYVRTARAKGVSASDTLLVHVLRNIMIPVVTNTVATLPFLLFGTIIIERQFQIPGLGDLLVEAINNQDSAVVMAVTYIIAILYCLALLASDLLYTLVDPRVALK